MLFSGTFPAADHEVACKYRGTFYCRGVYMKQSMNRVLLRGTVLLLAVLFAGGSLHAEDRALVTHLVGLARVQKGGQGSWKPLKLRDIISGKDRIQTGPQSRLIIMYGGVELRLGEKTEMLVANLKQGNQPIRLKLKEGFSWIKANKPLDNGLELSSPTAVASVRGTAFSVSHDDLGTATCVCNGVIATRANDDGEFKEVKKGFSRDFKDGQSVTNDFRELFRGLKVDHKFKDVIEADPKMKNCTMCHKMTDLATDHSPDPTDY